MSTEFNQIPNKTTCKFGEFYVDKPNFKMYVCVSSKEWEIGDYFTIYPVNCIVCPQPTPPTPPTPNPPNPDPDPTPNPPTPPTPPTPPIEYDLNCSNIDTVVYWSDASIWKNQTVPGVGANITIPKHCYIIMDTDVIEYEALTIDGIVEIKDENRIISSKFIWVKEGTLRAGQ